MILSRRLPYTRQQRLRHLLFCDHPYCGRLRRIWWGRLRRRLRLALA